MNYWEEVTIRINYVDVGLGKENTLIQPINCSTNKNYYFSRLIQ